MLFNMTYKGVTKVVWTQEHRTALVPLDTGLMHCSTLQYNIWSGYD